tara:strand:- start:219 stop:1574 length:1356 start_codon:yes stop_codon:yes gene_type:complete
MFFKNHILYLLIFIFFYSCAPKQVKVVPPAPRKIIPSWLSGISDDSLFLYGVSKVENNSTVSSDSLAKDKIIKMIKADFFKYLKKIDQNHDLNFSESKELFWYDRLKKISQYVSIYEDYNDGKHNYSLARFDKNSFTNAFHKEFAKTDQMNRERLQNIDSAISADNFKNIAKILSKTVFYTGSNGLIDMNNKDSSVISSLKYVEDYLNGINSRIILKFDSKVLNAMPLVNERKRIKVLAKDALTGKSIDGMWFNVMSVDNNNVDNYNDDLIITKKDGSVEYQVQEIGDEQNGYKLIFKTSFKSILKSDFVSLFRSMPERLSVSVIKNNPSIYFENTISNVDSLIKDSDAINAIRECFEAQYNGRFTRKKDKSTISLTFEITTTENSDKISKIYPNFVHSSGALVITDNWTQKNIYFQNIFETSGSDFNSVEKAGINSLKNLAKVVTSKICS